MQFEEVYILPCLLGHPQELPKAIEQVYVCGQLQGPSDKHMQLSAYVYLLGVKQRDNSMTFDHAIFMRPYNIYRMIFKQLKSDINIGIHSLNWPTYK